MQSLVIIGTSQSTESYVSEFITIHNVSPFNIIRYDTGVKISDVRSIQNLLSIKRSKSQMVVVVLSSLITVEAQNALLKTIEEPFENVAIFILAGTSNNLIPTVLSRCRIIATQDNSVEAAMSDKKYETLTTDKIAYYQIVDLIDSMSSTLSKDDYDKFIINVRCILLNSSTLSSSSRLQLTYLLKTLLENYLLVKNNNVNTRLVLEQSCIQSIVVPD